MHPIFIAGEHRQGKQLHRDGVVLIEKIGTVVHKMSEFMIQTAIIDKGFNKAVHRELWHIGIVDLVRLVDSRYTDEGI
jgi:hypothetical protein